MKRVDLFSIRYLRVPSKWFAMVSRKVFCGARRPFITGILHQTGEKAADSQTTVSIS